MKPLGVKLLIVEFAFDNVDGQSRASHDWDVVYCVPVWFFFYLGQLLVYFFYLFIHQFDI